MVDDPLKVALSETEMQTSRNQTHMLSKICVVTPGDESPTTLLNQKKDTLKSSFGTAVMVGDQMYFSFFLLAKYLFVKSFC